MQPSIILPSTDQVIEPVARPYQKLPQELRVKDALFFNTVKNVIDNMWNVAGLKLVQASS